MRSTLRLALIGLVVTASTALAVVTDPALDVGSASGSPGATVQIPISITRNGNNVTATSNLIQYDNTKFTPGTCVAQPPFSSPCPTGNDTGATTLNGRICSNNPPAISCTMDAECGPGNFCNVNSVVSLSLADCNMDLQPDPFVADGVFVLCPFTILAGAPPGVYTLTNTASWSDAVGSESAASGTNGSITIPDTDGDGVPDGIDNCPYTSNPTQTDTGGLGAGSPPDGIGNACQCGDVSNDGRVTNADSVIILRSFLVPPTAVQTNPQLCDVGPAASAIGTCTQGDSVIILRSGLVPPTATVLQHCAPANP